MHLPYLSHVVQKLLHGHCWDRLGSMNFRFLQSQIRKVCTTCTGRWPTLVLLACLRCLLIIFSSFHVILIATLELNVMDPVTFVAFNVALSSDRVPFSVMNGFKWQTFPFMLSNLWSCFAIYKQVIATTDLGIEPNIITSRTLAREPCLLTTPGLSLEIPVFGSW